MSRGAAIVALADDLTAMMNNPGGLSKLRGTHMLINHNTVYAASQFTRAESVMAGSRPDGVFDTVNPEDPVFAGGLALALASDFGVDDWTFALGLYGPNAVGDVTFPETGGQNYMMTDENLLLMFFTAGVAYGQSDWGVGATFQWAHLPFSRFTQTIDGEVDNVLPQPFTNNKDLNATLDLSDPGAFTMEIGGWYRPVSAIEIGLSARVIPIMLHPSGELRLEPITGKVFPGGDPEVIDGTAKLDITLPIIARAGVRYRHMSNAKEVFDIELDYVYEAWSVLEKYEIDLEGKVSLQGGAVVKDLQDIVLEKRWKDTHSLRLGGTYNAVPDRFSISLGGLWESAAVPHNYSNVDYPSFNRFGVGGGVRVQGWGLDINIGATHIFSETREVDELHAKQFMVRPLAPCPDLCGKDDATGFPGIGGVPVNAGKFEQSYTQVSVSLGVHFNEWF